MFLPHIPVSPVTFRAKMTLIKKTDVDRPQYVADRRVAGTSLVGNNGPTGKWPKVS